MKVLTVFGTRPEAIKLAPLIKELEPCPGIDSRVCVTGQHREMLDQVLKAFQITPHYDLAIMKPGQSLFETTVRGLASLESILVEERPDVVVVQGDTTTTFAASLAAYYLHVPVAHVEAGLSLPVDSSSVLVLVVVGDVSEAGVVRRSGELGTLWPDVRVGTASVHE